MHRALEEFCLVEEQVEMTGRVQFCVLETVDIVNVLVEDTEGQDRQGCVEEIVHGDEHGIEDRLRIYKPPPLKYKPFPKLKSVECYTCARVNTDK